MSSDSIDDLFSRLNLVGSTRYATKKKEADSLQDVLDESDFGIFKVVKDLGYFGWTPSKGGGYKTLDKVTKEEIVAQISLSVTPDELSDMQRINRTLPQQFAHNLPPQRHINKYPYCFPLIAPLHVAVKDRGVDLEKDVDFCFGGSTLEMLANQKIEHGDKYLVSLVPTYPNILCVTKFKEYEKDLSDIGFQFERLVTGKEFSDRHDETSVEHLQILEIGNYDVLLVAEVDAQKDGQPVEVKSSNPAYWGTKTMFQMISSGSTLLCAGTKSRGMLTRVELQTLSYVMQTALEETSVSKLERHIRDGMKALKREASNLGKDTTAVREIVFVGHPKVLTLRPVHGKVLFPTNEHVKKLL